MTESVVLVHGTRTSSSQWNLQLPGLREAGYLVSTPDLPGHGAHLGEPFTLEGATATIRRAVLTAAEATGPSTVHLVGSSLGGMPFLADLRGRWRHTGPRPRSLRPAEGLWCTDGSPCAVVWAHGETHAARRVRPRCRT